MKKMKVFFWAVFYKYLQSSLEKSLKNLSDYNHFLFKKRFEVNKKQIFPREKMKIFRIYFAVFCFKWLPKFSDFINCNDCIKQTKSKSIRLYPVFIQKRLWINRFSLEKYIFSGKKKRNWGSYISDYAHSFFGEDF